MSTATKRTTAIRPGQQMATRLRAAACGCGSVVCALLTAALFVTFLPIVTISYLSMWMDRYTDVASGDVESFRAPRHAK